MALNLVINGTEREVADVQAGCTLAVLVALLGLKGDRVAIERNGEIARRTAWGTLRMEDGDRLEIVHFVGGG